MNLQYNATNVQINKPHFILRLTNHQVYKLCVFGITNLRNLTNLRYKAAPVNSMGSILARRHVRGTHIHVSLVCNCTLPC